MKKTKLFTFAVITAVVGTLLFGVTSATSSYIHEADGTISICDPTSNGTKCITMQDKNLGASEAGTGASSYGKHYQWGNNHGFLPGENNSASFPGGESTGTNQVNCANYGPTLGWYDSDVFVWKKTDWCSPRNDNLRGGANDSQANNRGYDEENNVAFNYTGRQGPCGEGYHVPSIGEWSQVLKYWAANYTGEGNELVVSSNDGISLFNTISNPSKVILAVVTRFQEDFKIPFAGYRYSNYAEVYNVGFYASLWSSSPNVGSFNARYFYLTSNEANANSLSNRANGLSLRCFQNSYLSFPHYIESTNSGIQVTVGEIIYSGLSSNIMTVTTNNEVDVQEDKPVAGEVSVSFGENVSAKFSDLVKINVPVEDYDQVIIKVKHAGSSGYNFDGLTTNANASCDANGRPTSSQYNGELITVVNGFASIYTCEASDFIALGLGGGSGNNVSGVVVTLTLTAGENSCTINDYNLGTHNVSAQEQYVSASGQDIACRFLKNSGAIVTLSMGNLVDGTKTIGNQYFTGIVTNIGPSLGSIANLAGGSYNLGATRAIYTKGENTIGSWTGSLALEGTIPAGTPSGEYTGAIEIVIQQPTWTE